jgi:hypothetical protein
MVSTGTETADATVTGPGFDSQQVHEYDTYPVCLFVTLEFESNHSHERLITVELTVTHRRISAWSSFAIVAFAMISDSMTRNFILIRFTDAFARSRSSFCIRRV